MLNRKEAIVIEVEFERTTTRKTAPVTTRRMWFDAETKMLMKRSFEARIGNTIYFAAVEEYKEWDFEPKFKNDVFALPDDLQRFSPRPNGT